jgi:integrase
VTLRQVLKTALRHGWLDRLPDFSEPYRSSPKISHRAWFSPEEYKELYTATRQRAKEPEKRGFKWEAEQLHDYVRFAVNTGLRPDEARRLEFRDVTIVHDRDSDKTILEIEVRSKRGVGYCKSVPGAVLPFRRLRSRLRAARVDGVNTPTKTSGTSAVPSKQGRTPEPTDLIFPKGSENFSQPSSMRKSFASTAKGRPRTAYSLRHTYICMRLMEGADIYQIAKNYRTSVEMIEKY